MLNFDDGFIKFEPVKSRKRSNPPSAFISQHAEYEFNRRKVNAALPDASKKFH